MAVIGVALRARLEKCIERPLAEHVDPSRAATVWDEVATVDGGADPGGLHPQVARGPLCRVPGQASERARNGARVLGARLLAGARRRLGCRLCRHRSHAGPVCSWARACHSAPPAGAAWPLRKATTYADELRDEPDSLTVNTREVRALIIR